MADNVKYVTLRDPITNEILVPRMVGSLGYEVIEGETIPPFAMKNDADTLQGHPAEYFAKAGDMDAAKAVLDGIGNQYIWSIYKSRWNIVVGDETPVWITGFGEPGNYTSDRVYYADDISVDSNGNITFSGNVSNVAPYYNGTGMEDIAGKYFTRGDKSGYDISRKGVYYASGSAPITKVDNFYWVGYRAKLITTEYIEESSYVNSSDPNAYPPMEDDGYTYTALGQLGSKVRIETGSYVGNGTYGESNPNSLTFGFEPKLLIVGTNSGESAHFIWIYGWSDFAGASESSTYPLTLNGNTISWYGSKAQNQYNLSGTKYYYIAIG